MGSTVQWLCLCAILLSNKMESWLMYQLKNKILLQNIKHFCFKSYCNMTSRNKVMAKRIFWMTLVFGSYQIDLMIKFFISYFSLYKLKKHFINLNSYILHVVTFHNQHSSFEQSLLDHIPHPWSYSILDNSYLI